MTGELSWTRSGKDRKGRPTYRAGDYGVARGEWKGHGRAMTLYRASYLTTYTMRGWSIHERGRYVTRRRTLALAKATAEAHARLGPVGRRKLLAL
jgi:hypothetical protein